MAENLLQTGERYNIRAVGRALKLMSLLSDGKPRNLTELSEATGMNSSTIFRFLTTLARHHYVERDSRSPVYRLGIACLELARAYQEGSDIRRVALPELERLRLQTRETVHLAVLDRMEVVYIEKLHGLHAIGIMHSQVGGRAPAYCTGLGKVLLAHMDEELVRSHYSASGLARFSDSTITNLDTLMNHLREVRARGYALDIGEHEPEVRCVAVSIFGASGSALGAISVSGPASRMTDLESSRELIQNTLDTAGKISSRIGYSGKPSSAGLLRTP